MRIKTSEIVESAGHDDRTRIREDRRPGMDARAKATSGASLKGHRTRWTTQSWIDMEGFQGIRTRKNAEKRGWTRIRQDGPVRLGADRLRRASWCGCRGKAHHVSTGFPSSSSRCVFPRHPHHGAGARSARPRRTARAHPAAAFGGITDFQRSIRVLSAFISVPLSWLAVMRALLCDLRRDSGWIGC